MSETKATDKKYVAFVSWGNDSIALVQWLHEHEYKGVYCVFSDTGWSVPWWLERMEKTEKWARGLGYEVVRIQSIGMEKLISLKKSWPANGMQFCTEHLKIKPAIAWLEQVDPDRDLECVIGVRRCESKRRSDWPEHVEASDKHGERSLWSPLVRTLDKERDELLRRAGFEPLRHRSMECYPCVNANRADLRMLGAERIKEIERMETALAKQCGNKLRPMFRPGRFGNGVGIREACRWAQSPRAKYDKDQIMLFCDSGYCGD